MKRIRFARFVVVSTIMIFTLKGCASGEETDSPLVGTWLVAPRHVDPFVDAGIVAPMYPVLKIQKDGTFALFTVSTDCWDDESDVFYENSIVRDPLDEWEKCERQRNSDSLPKPQSAYVRQSADGRWHTQNGKLYLDVHDVNAPPFYIGLKNVGKPEAGRDYQWLADRMNLVGIDEPTISDDMAARFYSTYFILDGGEMEYETGSGSLSITKAPHGRSIGFGAARLEEISVAAAVVKALDVPSAEYFRCVLANVASSKESRLDPSERRRLIDLSEKVATISSRQDFLRVLERAGRDPDAAVVQKMLESDGEYILSLYDEMGELPAFRAAREERLGTYLGCPDRDNRPAT